MVYRKLQGSACKIFILEFKYFYILYGYRYKNYENIIKFNIILNKNKNVLYRICNFHGAPEITVRK